MIQPNRPDIDQIECRECGEQGAEQCQYCGVIVCAGHAFPVPAHDGLFACVTCADRHYAPPAMAAIALGEAA